MSDQNIYLSLAPTALRVKRQERYDGGGFDISLRDLAPEDVSLVIRVYQTVKGIYDLWLYMRDQPNYALLRQQLERLAQSEFISAAQAIGVATYAYRQPGAALRKAMHDIRGGGLTSLTGYASLVKYMPDNDAIVRQGVFLARDHAKMMRNVIPDLDVPTREADESSKLHAIAEFVDKWRGFTFNLAQKQVAVQAQSSYVGFITSRCLETSAVDRVLYNYINNAARFAATDRVCLTVLEASPGLTRWVVENEITADQQAWLQNTLGSDLTPLFQGGYTRGGHGIGLSSCTDIVAASFGVEPGIALAQKYLGAALHGRMYYAWFHWPAYVRQEGDEVCEC